MLTAPLTSLAHKIAALQVNHPDGITSGGNQFKVNDKGVILGNVGTGGSIDVSLSTVALSCSFSGKEDHSSFAVHASDS